MPKTNKLIILVIFITLYATLSSLTIAQPPSNYNQSNAGTQENPYLISNLANLRWLSENPEYWGGEMDIYYQNTNFERKYFSQTADIDAYETKYWNDGKGFTPISPALKYIDVDGFPYPMYVTFASVYNGNSFKINNLHFSDIHYCGLLEGSVGLFGYATNAELLNIVLDNVIIDLDHVGPGGDYWFNPRWVNIAPLLATSNFDTLIKNSSATGSITSVYDFMNENNDSRIGGLVGALVNSNIYVSYSTVDIEVTNLQAGVPYAHEAAYHVGGITGFASSSAIIQDSFYIGSIIHHQDAGKVGGFVGLSRSSDISNSYAVVNTNNSVMGGAVHTINRSAQGVNPTKINNSFWNSETSGTMNAFVFNAMHSAAGLINATPKNTAEMKFTNLYTNQGWDFDTIWATNEDFNNGYPFLRALHPNIYHIHYESEDDDDNPLPPGTPSNYLEPHAGTDQNPYLISNLENLLWMSRYRNLWWIDANTHVHFLQTADIDATETSSWNDGMGFMPITRFVGTYDGNNYTINNISINTFGLFMSIENQSVLKNINLTNFEVNYFPETLPAVQTNISVGSIVGVMYDSTITNVHVTGSINSGGHHVGGVVGRSNKSTITDCFSDINIIVAIQGEYNDNVPWRTDSSVGGIVAELNTGSHIKNSNSKGNISVNSPSKAIGGGIAGWSSSNSTIIDSFSEVNLSITGHYFASAGGIIGEFQNITISGCYSIGDVSATTYNKIIDRPYSGSIMIGGITGRTDLGGIINNSYSLSKIYGNSFADAYVGGISAITTAFILPWPNNNSPTITNSYFAGEINIEANENIFKGGIVGKKLGDYITFIDNNFWDINTSLILSATSEDTPPTNYGLTTAEMKNIQNYLNNGWDFTTVWAIHPEINFGYPYLRAMYPHTDPINLPNPVTLLAPVNNHFGNDLQPIFTWLLPENNADIIGLKFNITSDESNWGNPILLDSDATEYLLPYNITYDTKYLWRVVAYNQAGDSINNEVFSFMIINENNIEIPRVKNPVAVETDHESVQLSWDITRIPAENETRFTHARDSYDRAIGFIPDFINLEDQGFVNWSIAQRFMPDQLETYGVAGQMLTEVSFMVNSISLIESLDIQIYTGGSWGVPGGGSGVSQFNPGILVYEQAVDLSRLEYVTVENIHLFTQLRGIENDLIWNDIVLDEPVLIPTDAELWIAIRATAINAPFVLSRVGSGFIGTDKQGLIYNPGLAKWDWVWPTLTDTHNWMIRGLASPVGNGFSRFVSDKSFSIYRSKTSDINSPNLWTQLVTNYIGYEYTDYTWASADEHQGYTYIIQLEGTETSSVTTNSLLKTPENMFFIGDVSSESLGWQHPANLNNTQNITQTIYDDSRLEIGATINKIMLQIQPVSTILPPIKLYLATTEKSVFAVGENWIPFEDFTLVYEGSLPINQEFVTLSLIEPYEYTENNLVVMLYHDYISYQTPNYKLIHTRTNQFRTLYANPLGVIGLPEDGLPLYPYVDNHFINIGFDFNDYDEPDLPKPTNFVATQENRNVVLTWESPILYGTHLFVPDSVGIHTELGTNKCVPYRQNGNPTEQGVDGSQN